MRKGFLCLIILMSFAACNRNGISHPTSTESKKQDSTIIEIGEKLEKHYPFDSIKELWIHNWKGERKLSDSQKDSVIEVLKNARLYQFGASIKPGHLHFTLIFNNGKTDEFYGSNNILIFEGGEFYNQNKTIGEFHFDQEFNFENF